MKIRLTLDFSRWFWINFVDEDPSLFLAGNSLPPQQQNFYAQNSLVDEVVQPLEPVPRPSSVSFDNYVQY